MMNHHYRNAVAALDVLDDLTLNGAPASEAVALGVLQAQASLAAAKATADLLAAQQTANVIAYAHLCKATGDGALYYEARALADKLIAAQTGMDFTFPEEF